jgi:hypothetical protein
MGTMITAYRVEIPSLKITRHCYHCTYALRHRARDTAAPRRGVKWWRLSAGVLALNRISFASELACVYARAVPLKFTNKSPFDPRAQRWVRCNNLVARFFHR